MYCNCGGGVVADGGDEGVVVAGAATGGGVAEDSAVGSGVACCAAVVGATVGSGGARGVDGLDCTLKGFPQDAQKDAFSLALVPQ